MLLKFTEPGAEMFAISAPCFIVFVFFIVYAVLKRINIPLAKKGSKSDSKKER